MQAFEYRIYLVIRRVCQEVAICGRLHVSYVFLYVCTL